MPGEGKSRLAQKITARFAQNGQRVLLLDGDLRRPTLEKQPIAGRVGPVDSNKPDFSLVLQGDAVLDQAIFPVRLPDDHDRTPGDVYYDFLGAEDAVSSALAGQLMAEKLLGLMQDLRHRYDYIVVDAPPVLAVADAIWLMRAADDRLLLLRAQKSRRDDILDAIQRLEQADCAADGLIFSGVSRRGAYYGGKKRRKRS
jgi:Mrp family chromosome partitioning ATPase